MTRLYGSVFCLFVPLLASAHPGAGIRWRSVGPSPPAIEAPVLVDAANHTLYIGSNGGGVLKSTNDGASFRPVNNGLNELTVAAMVMDPKDPQTLYASTGFAMYKTIDGAASWQPIGGSGVTLVIDPTDTNVIYAGLSPRGGVIKSTDGGRTFIDATNGLGIPAVFALAIDPGNPQVLYVGTLGKGAFKSTDGAATWTPLNIDPTIWSLLVDPDNSNVVYAGSGGRGVYKSVDGGETFFRVGSPEVGVVLALAKSGGELFAGTASQGVSVSGDGGRHWRDAGVTPNTALILSVGTRGEVYVGTNIDGVFVHSRQRFHDRDGEWQRLAREPLQRCACQNGHAIAVDPNDRDHVLLSTNDGGLLATEDGGRHWFDAGVNGLMSRAPRGIAFDPQAPQRVYTGAFIGTQGMFRSEDHGRHWHTVHFGAPDIYVAGVTVDPVDHAVYATTFQGGQGLWKSTDFGTTFRRIDRAPGAAEDEFLGLTGRNVTVDPHNHRTIFMAVNAANAGIWRSQDGGVSWAQVDASDVALSVTIDPNDSNVVYAGAAGSGVLKSIDGGAHFTAMSQGLPVEFQTSRTGSVLVDPRRSNVVYVGFEGAGVYASTDGAESWHPLNADLDDLNVFGLALDATSPQGLYAATAHSVFKTGRP
jgi:photosystem II stability/assembly factor-like uncharacterized protein